jgi:hypothetical protein
MTNTYPDRLTERDKTAELVMCRLKGHDILRVFPREMSIRKINMIKRKIFKGKISKNKYMKCITCNNTHYQGQVDAVVNAFKNTAVSVHTAAKSFNDMNKTLNNFGKVFKSDENKKEE